MLAVTESNIMLGAFDSGCGLNRRGLSDTLLHSGICQVLVRQLGFWVRSFRR